MSRKMWDGNRIVMVSDGVLDALPGDDKEQVMKQYLESVEEMGPRNWQIRYWNLLFRSSPLPGTI